jgi:hypothetical protein
MKIKQGFYFNFSALLLAAMFLLAGCDNPVNNDGSSSLQGTWLEIYTTWGGEDYCEGFIFSGNTFMAIDGAPWDGVHWDEDNWDGGWKGTFTAGDNTLTLTTTHIIWGNDGWFTKEEALAAYPMNGDDVNDQFEVSHYSYVISGNQLTLTTDEGIDLSYIKQ